MWEFEDREECTKRPKNFAHLDASEAAEIKVEIHHSSNFKLIVETKGRSQ